MLRLGDRCVHDEVEWHKSDTTARDGRKKMAQGDGRICGALAYDCVAGRPSG